MAVILTATFLLILTASSAVNVTDGEDDRTAPPYLLQALYSTSAVSGLKGLVIQADGWIRDDVRLILVTLREKVGAPVMRVAAAACMVMSVMLLAEVVGMAAVSFWVLISRRKPEKVYNWEKIGSNPENLENSFDFPMVLVQIPMFNEKEVYKLSIGAVCELAWPRDRLIIQVLDDSTDLMVKALVQSECEIWASKGMNIFYEVRDNRKGYKAGALKEGMQHSYVQLCEFVAMFDADFQPEPDFLTRTIPFLVHNPRLCLVQARWEFVNYKECLMTRIQKMTLDYHFKVEQEAGSATHAFFGFNGTAGVWRISAISESGGWNDRTTVEDMDLAVRAGLRGWKFVYVHDLKVKSELPSDFKAFRSQQHRWTCGAANLFRKMAKEILITKEVSVWRKLYVLYNFFFVRKIISHIVSFSLYSIVIPASVLVPEVTIPVWAVVHIPTTITILHAVRNPRHIHLIPFWILFENVMAMHRFKATLIGLLEAGSAHEWVVTEKLGGVPKSTIETPLLQKYEKPRYRDRINFQELGFAFFLFFCACFDLTYGNHYYHIYIFVQSCAFFIVGLGYVGTFISSS